MSHNNPLVSVLIAAYNCELYVEKAINSVLKQNYLNIELIIVNDCSTDNTLSICNKIASFDTRVQVYTNECNLGDYGNRNRAASLSNGKYLKFLDHDDYLYPYSISLMVEFMEANPTASYGFSYREVQVNNQPFPVLISPSLAYKSHFLDNGLFYAGPGSSIIVKSAFDSVGGFSGKRFVGDFELWLKLSLTNDCIIFQSGLIWWRIHPDQESRKAYYSQFALNLLSNYNLAIEYLNNEFCPLKKDQVIVGKIIQYSLFSRHLLIILFKKAKPLLFFELLHKSRINKFELLKSLIPLRVRLYLFQL